MVDVIFGTDRFQVQKEIDRIQDKAKKDFGNFERLSFASSDPDFNLQDVYESVMTMSLFGEGKFIVFLIESEKDAGKLDENILLELIQLDQFDINLVIWMAKKPLAKTKLKKLIDKHARVSDLKKVDLQGVRNVVNQQLREMGLRMDPNALSLFLKRINGDLLRANTELEKLSVLDGVISLEHIDTLVNESFDDAQFALSNALMDKNLKEAFAVYHRLLESKMDPLALLGMIASSLRGVYQVMILTSEGYNHQTIADLSGMSIGQVKYVVRSQRRNPQDVLRLLNDLADIDQKAKLGLIDRHLSFELFMLKLK